MALWPEPFHLQARNARIYAGVNVMVTPTLRAGNAGRVFFVVEAIMQNVARVAINLGKHAFHLHGQGRQGQAVFCKKVSRKQPVAFFATV